MLLLDKWFMDKMSFLKKKMNAKYYLKQSNTDPTTSSANSFGSLPVNLPILKKAKALH